MSARTPRSQTPSTRVVVAAPTDIPSELRISAKGCGRSEQRALVGASHYVPPTSWAAGASCRRAALPASPPSAGELRRALRWVIVGKDVLSTLSERALIPLRHRRTRFNVGRLPVGHTSERDRRSPRGYSAQASSASSAEGDSSDMRAGRREAGVMDVPYSDLGARELRSPPLQRPAMTEAVLDVGKVLQL